MPEIYSRTAAQALRVQIQEASEAERGHEITSDFLGMMRDWHASPEVYDDALEAEILEQQAQILRNPRKLSWGPKGTRYLPPSSANSCPRELYMRLTGAQKDKTQKQAHQGAWQQLGTALGDMTQRNLLFIEKHGPNAPFKPVWTKEGYPAWENFVKTVKAVEHRGHTIYLLGKPDGYLTYKDGSRVGLEVKSKQTTYSQTTEYSLRSPKEDHIKQMVAYTLMYPGTDEFIYYVVNASKKAWNMTDEEAVKYPYQRAFYVKVTEQDRITLLDYYADVYDAVAAGVPPKLDLDKFTFNNYKTACALSLSNEELTEIREQVSRMLRSSLKDWQKQSYVDALDCIEKVRGEAV